MRALADRQDGLIAQLADSDRLSVDAIGIAPFVTGMGNEHPLENGFAFLNPHGLPYLPGSGIKGVLRAAAEELAGDPRRDWRPENTFGWDQMFDTSQKERRSAIELLFGHDPQDGQKAAAPLFRGLLDIWDVIPRLDKGSNLMVEVMTPHQKEYYEGKATPHDSGQPIPIKFLAVPPGARFTFHLRIDRARMQSLGVTDTLGKVWQDLMRAAFDHAFEWLGFGAKTSLGYGAMAIDSSASETRREKQKAQAEQRAAAAESALLESLSEEDRERHEAEKRIAAFRACTQEARKQPYQPGGVYDQERNDFIKVVTQWDDP
ncbi:type III-B CRISPR module RAMP protein Cmr6, partial [Ectothiorhodospira lacustris]|uniref:type III-B CRISPR module RAMP protein Cmr6 n=1 Tax=Ectothiorhodospira lacustris TaxID=2899127 RepID=UPI001EE99266